jgi:hypothetical protein
MLAVTVLVALPFRLPVTVAVTILDAVPSAYDVVVPVAVAPAECGQVA